ncbi:MAG: hypothetical protein Q8S73_36910 [Deltaproteobacteria bacterium]|nr:hypothetical protein [Myxococcales bacterium]MDP3219741.1 hypothetical protein [Deltaproteobacteria bacterium]
MAATLDDIEGAIFATLQTLLRSAATPGPFVTVDRWAGEVTQADGVDEVTLGKSPSALLAFEESVPEGEDGAETETLLRDTEVIERHVFRVYVTVKDPRGIPAATKGTVGQPGVLRCARLVKEALAGLEIAGLAGGDVVRLVQHRPWSIVAGSHYTHIVRLSARASLPATTLPAPGVPFTGMDANLTDAPSDEGGTPMPLAGVRIDTA